MLPLLRCFFAHLLILQYPDHHQNLISSYLYYSGPVHKISSQSVHNFLSNVVHRQTNKQTNKQTDKLTNATKNITSFAKEVITSPKVLDLHFHLDQGILKLQLIFSLIYSSKKTKEVVSKFYKLTYLTHLQYDVIWHFSETRHL